MRQLNFLLFFALCLGLALFSIENTQTAPINLIPGQQIEFPLSIELLVAAGTGALLAWMFSVWDQLQRQIDSWKTSRTMKQQGKKIEELEEMIAELQAESETTIDTEAQAESTTTEKEEITVEVEKQPVEEDDTEEKTSTDEVASKE